MVPPGIGVRVVPAQPAAAQVTSHRSMIQASITGRPGAADERDPRAHNARGRLGCQRGAIHGRHIGK
jgi:hypothetical protein